MENRVNDEKLKNDDTIQTTNSTIVENNTLNNQITSTKLQTTKNHKGLIIFLIVIIIILLGICGYFIYDNLIKNKNNSNDGTQKTEELPNPIHEEPIEEKDLEIDNDVAALPNSGIVYYIVKHCVGCEIQTKVEYYMSNYETYNCKANSYDECKVYANDDDRLLVYDNGGYYIYDYNNYYRVGLDIQNIDEIKFVGNGLSIKADNKYGYYSLAQDKLLIDFKYDTIFYKVSPSNYLFAATNDNVINVFDEKTGKVIKTISGGKGLTYYEEGFYALNPEEPSVLYYDFPPILDLLDSQFNSIFKDKKFSVISSYQVNSDNTITVIDTSSYKEYIPSRKYYIYDEAGNLKQESKEYTVIYKAVKDYLIVNDEKVVKVIDIDGNEVASLVTLTDDMYVHSMLSGWYTENGKNGIYVVVEFGGFGEGGSGKEYYYLPSTGEIGSIDVDTIGGYAKPVLYLYPEETTKVSISFEKPENLTTTYPKYKNNWIVTAKPNGDLFDEKNKYYYGLYWEEVGSTNVSFDEGFYVAKDDASSFLEEKCEEIGLNRREANEFIMYWLPILEKNEKNLVYFEFTDSRNAYNKLNISPAPDSILRMAIHVKKVNQEISIKPQVITSFERNGFTAVEWGGVIH